MCELSRHARVRPVRAPGSHVEFRGKRAFLSDAGGAVVLAVNNSAAAIWELCDGETAIDEMVTAICEMSSLTPDRVTSEVEATIKVFEQAGLVSL